MSITLKDVGSGFKRTAINENFTGIETEINNNLLSKNGGNALEAALDFNSNRGINVADGVFGTDLVNVSQLNSIVSGSGGLSSIAQAREVQLGSAAVANVFTLTGITYAVGVNTISVYRNGQRLEKTVDYAETSSSSVTLTFTPNSADRFVFITNDLSTSEFTTTAVITHSQPGTSYNLGTYLQNRHIVNIRDFGAVGDGVTDDTVAIQAAIDSLSNGDSIRFPRASYVCGLLSSVDQENIHWAFEGSTLIASSGTPDHILRIENTTEEFKRGHVVRDLTCAGACASGIKVVGGAWTNMEFRRIFSNTLVATSLIYHYNHDAIARNPSNFVFDTIWNKSFDVQYCIQYSTAVSATSVDNFEYTHILHWSNQTTPAVIKYNLAAAQYSTYSQVYGALYATGASVIDTGTSAVVRSRIRQVLMEGSQDGRDCLSGNYLETSIHNIVNFIDESVYTAGTNHAVNGKVQDCELFNCLTQDSSSGYSTNNSVVLLALSQNNTLHRCNVVSDSGTNNLVVGNIPEYEEAAFTPSLELGGVTTGITYTAQTGWYSKTKNTISYSFTIILSSKGAATGAAVVQGLPYTSKTGVTTMSSVSLTNTTFADVPLALVDSATSAVRLREVNTVGTASNLDDTNLTNSSVIIVTGTYFV